MKLAIGGSGDAALVFIVSSAEIWSGRFSNYWKR